MNELIEQSVYNKNRKDKFNLVLTLPDAMRDIAFKLPENRDQNHVIPDTLQFSVFGAVLPSITVDSGEIRYSGQAVKFSAHSRPAYPNITVNFTVDNRFNNYWVIWKWLDLLNNDELAIFYKDYPDYMRHNPKDSMFDKYQGTATLTPLDEYNQPVMKFDYHGVLPVTLGQIDYNYRTADQIDTTFEFSFSKLIPILL